MRDVQLGRQCPGQAFVLRTSARQHQVLHQADPPHHRVQPRRHRDVDPGDDAREIGPFIDESDDLRLREHAALIADDAGLLALILQSRDSLQPAGERPGHRLEEPAGAGSAPVVHREVEDGALFGDGDDLAVLASDVHDGPGGGSQPMSAAGVARDLGDVLLGEGNLEPAVAGADDVVEVIDRRQPGLADRFFHDQARRLLGARRRGDQVAPDDLPVLHDDRLSGGGTDIDASNNHGHGQSSSSDAEKNERSFGFVLIIHEAAEQVEREGPSPRQTRLRSPMSIVGEGY